jgi:hypothetical protein
MTNSKAIVALVLGILAFFVPVPYVLGIVAIVLGNQARREIAADPKQEGDGLAIAGLVLGWIDIVLSTLLLVFLAVFFAFFFSAGLG